MEWSSKKLTKEKEKGKISQNMNVLQRMKSFALVSSVTQAVKSSKIPL